MSKELQKWNPGFASEPDDPLEKLDELGELEEFNALDDEPEIIDVDWTPVNTVDDSQQYIEDSYSLDDYDDDYDDYSSGGSTWGGSWLQPAEEPEPADTLPTAYAEPDVVDTPFTFLRSEPDESQYPVKSNRWGAGWFSGGNSDSKEIAPREAEY